MVFSNSCPAYEAGLKRLAAIVAAVSSEPFGARVETAALDIVVQAETLFAFRKYREAGDLVWDGIRRLQAEIDSSLAERRERNRLKSARCAANKAARRERDRAFAAQLGSGSGRKK